MATVIIDRRGTVLSHQSGALLIRAPESKPKTIPLRMISRLVLHGGSQLDSGLLTQLAEHGVSLLALPGRGQRRAAFLYGTGHGDAVRRLGQYRLVTDAGSQLFWAKVIVALKIGNSCRLLGKALAERPDQRLALRTACQQLEVMARQARAAETLATLRGLEGSAAATFFRAYAALLPPDAEFTGRNRRPPRDPVNAALSLGYALVHGDALRALTQAGLDPLLGFLHEPSHNRESLACDLAEVGRSGVERMVWRLFAERQLRPEMFRRENGAALLRTTARGVFFAAYESMAERHRRLFARAARLLAKACLEAAHEAR